MTQFSRDLPAREMKSVYILFGFSGSSTSLSEDDPIRLFLTFRYRTANTTRIITRSSIITHRTVTIPICMDIIPSGASVVVVVAGSSTVNNNNYNTVDSRYLDLAHLE